MLIAMTYVDNLERCHYDIPFVVKNWEADRKIIFAGGNETVEILQSMFKTDVQIIQIPIRVSKASDIPLAFNYSVKLCYENLGADAVLLSHADVYLTKLGMDAMLDAYKRGLGARIACDLIQLYSYLWTYHPPIVMSTKDYPVYWDTDGDGSVNHGAGPNDLYYHDERHLNPDMVLDIGMFTVDIYKNKMMSHSYVWPDVYKIEVVKAFNKDIRAGLRMAYRSMRKVNWGAKLIPMVESRYTELLDHYNAWSEYRLCLEVQNEVNRD